MIRFKKNVRPEAKKAARKLFEEYKLDDGAGLELIFSFADSMTTELNCLSQIELEGMTIADRFGQVKPHPLLTVLRDARSQKLQALRLMNLPI